MKLQFTTQSILAGTAFMALWLVVIRFYIRVNQPAFIHISYRELYDLVQESLPLWAPVIFLAYSVGRRDMTFRILLAFAATELLAFAWVWFFR